jgi:hypothetical protein
MVIFDVFGISYRILISVESPFGFHVVWLFVIGITSVGRPLMCSSSALM